MPHVVHRYRALAALSLLLAGLLGLVAPARAATCPQGPLRVGDPVAAAQGVTDGTAAAARPAAPAPDLLGAEHAHDPAPEGAPARVPTTRCTSTLLALPVASPAPVPASPLAGAILLPDATGPGRLLVSSLFRPPRAS